MILVLQNKRLRISGQFGYKHSFLAVRSQPYYCTTVPEIIMRDFFRTEVSEPPFFGHLGLIFQLPEVIVHQPGEGGVSLAHDVGSARKIFVVQFDRLRTNLGNLRRIEKEMRGILKTIRKLKPFSSPSCRPNPRNPLPPDPPNP